MHIPRSFGNESMRMIVQTRGNSFDIERQTGTEDIGMGETRPTTTTITVTAYLFAPNEENDEVDAGERLSGELNGLCESEEDIQPRDIFTYRSQRWSVTETQDVGDGVLQRIGLERIEHD